MAFDLAAFLAHRPGHGGLLGLSYHDQGANWAAIALPWRAELAGADGELAPGVSIALMDVAGAAAIWRRLGRLIPQVTIDLRFDRWRAPAVGGGVVGRAECTAIIGDVGFFRGEVSDGSGAFAGATGSYMLLGGGA